jgi:hypothetical protein
MKPNFVFASYRSALSALIAVVLSACSPTHMSKNYASEILYTQFGGGANVSAWIFNVDNGKSWKIEESLWARGWSPSGEKILLDGDSQNKYGQVWISSSDGRKLTKVFDINDHPDLIMFFPEKQVGPAQNTFWLTDSILLIQPEKGPIILYDIQRKQVVEVRDGAVMKGISPKGEYWIEFNLAAAKYLLVSLKSSPVELPQYNSLAYYAYHISQDGTKIAYSVSKDKSYYLAISDIKINLGINNERTLVTLPTIIRDFHWSPSDTALLYAHGIGDGEIRCIVIDITTGEEIFNQPCESKTDVLMWSPRADGFLTQPNLQQYFFYRLDGSVQTLLEVSPNAGITYQVVDWRLIESP